MRSQYLYPLALLASTLIINPAIAYEKGDMLLRAGYAQVNPDDGSDPLLGNGGLGLLAGDDGAAAKDASSLGLTFAYFLSDSLAIQVLAALPFEHDIEGTGIIDGAPLGHTKHLPPTVTVQYYPNIGGGGFQPYVGAGINYTTFWDSETTQFTTDTVNLLLGGGVQETGLDIDDSFGLAFEVGADIQVSDAWFLNVAAWYIDIDAEATVEVNGQGVYSFDVNIDPWAFMVGAGMKF